MQHPNIEIKFNTVIDKYTGDRETGLTGFTLRDVTDGSTRHEDTGGLFMGIGHRPSTEFLQSTGIHLTEQGYIRTTENVYTSIEGIFACGDVHDQHYRQAITASGFGCMAAIAAERWLK